MDYAIEPFVPIVRETGAMGRLILSLKFLNRICEFGKREVKGRYSRFGKEIQ